MSTREPVDVLSAIDKPHNRAEKHNLKLVVLPDKNSNDENENVEHREGKNQRLSPIDRCSESLDIILESRPL